eukprot:gene25754-11418_t
MWGVSIQRASKSIQGSHLSRAFSHALGSLMGLQLLKRLTRLTERHARRFACAGLSTVTTAMKHALLLLVILLTTLQTGGFAMWALLLSIPRAARAIWWMANTVRLYRALLAQYSDQDSDECQAALSELHVQCGSRLTLACRANGGMYIKAGQIGAMFGSVPPEYRPPEFALYTLNHDCKQRLALLEDKAVPRSYESIGTVLLAELGPDAESLFSYFEEGAVAAASLALVHRARLHKCIRTVLLAELGPGAESLFSYFEEEAVAAASLAQDKAVPRSYESIRTVLLSELGPDADSLFSYFEEEAVAAASLAQVHRARLQTGEEVAVKLQYPGLQSAVLADLVILKFLAK